jgi:hypothetical protein
MRLRLIVALLGVTILGRVSVAQLRGPTMSMPRVSLAGRPPFRSFGSRAIFLGSPLLYADYPAQPWAVQSPPQVVVVQPESMVDVPETRSEPLLIELQGNKYVRFGGRQQSAERGMNAPPDYAEAETHPLIARQPVQPELTPAILIFRDGHREQIREYAIVAGTLYASGDYWQSGHWTKNIQLSVLDLPATMQANQEAGIKFKLPSAPNEVVTRP